MDECESLSHMRWDCKYHVVFIPKCRRKALYGDLRRHLGEIVRRQMVWDILDILVRRLWFI
jgi:putative transposase